MMCEINCTNCRVSAFKHGLCPDDFCEKHKALGTEEDFIRTLQPEPKWIPCSETVDIPDHEILACDKYGEEMFGYLVYEDDQWLCVSDNCMMYDPIAWREKPEPYREEGEK